jgi:hypothetical protein
MGLYQIKKASTQQKKQSRAHGAAQVLEHLPSKCEALS